MASNINRELQEVQGPTVCVTSSELTDGFLTISRCVDDKKLKCLQRAHIMALDYTAHGSTLHEPLNRLALL
jgi:hypothetical protein